MAVRKKKKTSKKTSKKISKKKVDKKSSPNQKEMIRLDQAEMRKLEELNYESVNLETKCKLQDQYAANVRLKIESLQSQIKLLEHEFERAREKQKVHAEKLKSKLDRLYKLGNELKLKYGIKSQGHIKYDGMTGEIVE